MLRAHAFLWSNQPGKATTLLLSCSPSDLQAWRAFAERLVAEHPANALAWFLLGDAQARLADGKAAEASLDQALTRTPRLVPALIARGTARALRGDHDAAEQDFDAACTEAPTLAEAHASLASLLVLRREAEGALQSANRAVELAPEYSLALNTRGCAQFGKGQWEAAAAEFDRAWSGQNLTPFSANRREVLLACDNASAGETADAPWFRMSDFVSWIPLVTASQDRNTAIHQLHGAALPTNLDLNVLKRLNAGLEDANFVERIQPLLTAELRGTERVRAALTALRSTDRRVVATGNRVLVETLHPGMIAPYDQRNPGVNVTTTKGFQIQFPGWKPPVAGQGQKTSQPPGGVSVDLSRARIDRGDWPVTTTFGLLYGTILPKSSAR